MKRSVRSVATDSDDDEVANIVLVCVSDFIDLDTADTDLKRDSKINEEEDGGDGSDEAVEI